VRQDATQAFTQKLLNARLQGKQAMQVLAEDHLPLVAASVRRFPWHYKEKEELYQQGCIGLMKALARYDPGYGVAFSTFATALILGEMKMLCRLDTPIHIPRSDRELRNRIRQTTDKLALSLGREPTVQELASVLRTDPSELTLAMESISIASGNTTSGQALIELLPDQDRWIDRMLLRDMISRLSPPDQKLLLLRFRLGKTQVETARVLGMSQVQVSRRESLVKEQLRKAWMCDE